MSSDYESVERQQLPLHLTGRFVLDANMQKVGKVTDVLFDDRGAAPRWAVVKTGVLTGEHFVPVDDTYVDQDGRLVVPLDKTTIKRAPLARRDHVLTVEARRDLRDFYGIAV